MPRDPATPPRPDEENDLTSLVPLPDSDVPALFDPNESSALIRRGLDRLLSEEIAPEAPRESYVNPSRALSACATQLGQSMLAHFDEVMSSRRIAFTPDQRLLALACLYVCAHAGERPSPSAMTRLGAVTDLVADESRFWWWNALPLQLALNVAGEGNGGYRTLYGNLSHPEDSLRQEMVAIAWIARDHLELRRLVIPLLASVEAPGLDWAGSLALLYAACPTEDVFTYVIKQYEPTKNSDLYNSRVADLADSDSPLRRYLRSPDNLLAIEDAARSAITDDADDPVEL